MEMVNPAPKPEITEEENNSVPEPQPEDFTLLKQAAPKQNKQLDVNLPDESFIKLNRTHEIVISNKTVGLLLVQALEYLTTVYM